MRARMPRSCALHVLDPTVDGGSGRLGEMRRSGELAFHRIGLGDPDAVQLPKTPQAQKVRARWRLPALRPLTALACVPSFPPRAIPTYSLGD